MLWVFLLGGIAEGGDAFTEPATFGPQEFPYQIIETFAQSGQDGIITAVKGDPQLRASTLQQTFYAKTGEHIRLDLLIGNYSPNVLKLNIICLVDYKQISFSLGNRTQQNIYSIEIPPAQKHKEPPRTIAALLKSNKIAPPARQATFSMFPRERVILPLLLPPLERGGHDVILLGLRADSQSVVPDNKYEFARRLNVLVESGDMPTPNYVTAASGMDRPRMPEVVINRSGDINDFSTLDMQDEESAQGYYLHIRNNSGETTRYAATILRNDIQMDGAAPDPMYFELAGKMSGVLHLRLDTPPPNPRMLRAIVAQAPYLRLENPHGKLVEQRQEIIVSPP